MADDIEKLLEIIAVQGEQTRALQARVAELECRIRKGNASANFTIASGYGSLAADG